MRGAWRRAPSVVTVVIAASAATASAMACGAAPRRDVPVATVMAAYLQALRANDSRTAWELLATDVKQGLAYETFAASWHAAAAERGGQAAALADALADDAAVEEHAQVTYPDGKTLHLVRSQGPWQLESALASRTVAHEPRDAVEIFARALGARSYDSVMAILSAGRRRRIGHRVTGFARSLAAHMRAPIHQAGPDRAELTWDDDGMRYKVVLVREGAEWRVDDFDMHAIP
jgi:hypothetical protein